MFNKAVLWHKISLIFLEVSQYQMHISDQYINI